MKYLKAEDILVINARVIQETGGSQGVRDVHLLRSLVERPKTTFGGEAMYRTVFDKAAVYFDSIIHYHVFLDGNKRTALVTTARFLYQNGYSLTATNKEVERYTLRTAVKKPEIKEIATWFKAHTKKRSAQDR